MHKRVATNGTHGSTLGELAGDLVCSILPTLDTQYIVVHTNGDDDDDELIRRLQYGLSYTRREAATDGLSTTKASEYDSRCVHMYDL